MYTISGKSYFKDNCEVHVYTYKEISPKTRIHTHDFIEIAYATKGVATHHVENKKYEILAGDIFVINSSQYHYYTKTNNLEICYILVGPQMLKKKLKHLENIHGFYEFFYIEPIFREETKFSQHLHVKREIAGEIEDILEKMKMELKIRGDGYKIMVESLLMEFFITISRLYYGFCLENINSEEISFKKKAVNNVIAFIEQHYKEDITLSDLAKCGCLQSQYLCRVFKKLAGMTMIEYLTHFRIKKASELLAYTADSVTDTCFKVGFNDLSYFIRTFHRIMGMPPSQLRKKSK